VSFTFTVDGQAGPGVENTDEDEGQRVKRFIAAVLEAGTAEGLNVRVLGAVLATGAANRDVLEVAVDAPHPFEGGVLDVALEVDSMTKLRPPGPVPPPEVPGQVMRG
jgi:hypothetical protein